MPATNGPYRSTTVYTMSNHKIVILCTIFDIYVLFSYAGHYFESQQQNISESLVSKWTMVTTRQNPSTYKTD